MADRNGLYVTISPAGTITFRYAYRINGRQETLTIGRYRSDGTIPTERMKAKRTHNVYLSAQAIDLIIAFQIYSEGSPYLLPGRINRRQPITRNSLNRIIANCIKFINKDEQRIDDFTVHDLRRTGSTLLHEMGFNSDWIEKILAHEQHGVRAVYNKAEYAEQRKEMMQIWADKIDDWIKGENL